MPWPLSIQCFDLYLPWASLANFCCKFSFQTHNIIKKCFWVRSGKAYKMLIFVAFNRKQFIIHIYHHNLQLYPIILVLSSSQKIQQSTGLLLLHCGCWFSDALRLEKGVVSWCNIKATSGIGVNISVKQNSASKCEMTKQYTIQPTWACHLDLSTHKKQNCIQVIKIYAKDRRLIFGKFLIHIFYKTILSQKNTIDLSKQTKPTGWVQMSLLYTPRKRDIIDMGVGTL